MPNGKDNVYEKLTKALFLQKVMNKNVARLQQQVCVANNPELFNGDLAHHALTANPDNQRWDLLWEQFAVTKNTQALDYLDRIWAKVESELKLQNKGNPENE